MSFSARMNWINCGFFRITSSFSFGSYQKTIRQNSCKADRFQYDIPIGEGHGLKTPFRLRDFPSDFDTVSRVTHTVEADPFFLAIITYRTEMALVLVAKGLILSGLFPSKNRGH